MSPAVTSTTTAASSGTSGCPTGASSNPCSPRAARRAPIRIRRRPSTRRSSPSWLIRRSSRNVGCGDRPVADIPSPIAHDGAVTRPRALWLLAGIVIVLGAALWLGYRGLQARRHLVDASDLASVVRDDLLHGDRAGARARLEQMQRDAHDARSLTDDPLWRLAGAVPLFGRTFSTTADIAAMSDDLAQQVMPQLVEAGDALAPNRLRVNGDTIALPALHQAQIPLDRSAQLLSRLTTRAGRLPRSFTLSQVVTARDRTVAQLARLAGIVHTADDFSHIGPAMLGENGVRRYFVAVENNAESRGTGGLVGAFLILEADHGRLHVTRSGSDLDLHDATHPVIDLGRSFDHLYRPYGSDTVWANSNISPHLPFAARIWAALWQRQTGQRVDGALTIDPVALSDLLAATGPFQVAGIQVSSANVVELLLRRAYVLYQDPVRRKRILQIVARAAVARVTSGQGDADAVANEIGRAIGTHHLGMWSAHPDEQRVLESTPAAQVVPQVPTPYAALVVSNAAGSKLDYYLRRTLVYRSTGCDGARRRTQITVRLTNAAPPGLPSYVTARLDRPGPVGSDSLIVAVYGTSGATLHAARLDGAPTTLTVETERGHPVFSTQIEMLAGHTRVLTLDLDEPDVSGPSLFPEQPLVEPQLTEVALSPCR